MKKAAANSMATHLKDTLEDYRHFLKTGSGLSARSVRCYADDLARLSETLEAAGAATLASIDQRQLRHAVARWHRQGLHGRSIARMLSAARHYFDWLIDRGLAKTNPARKLKAPKSPKRLPTAMSADLLTHLFDHLLSDPSPDPIKLRDIAMLELCYSCGLRLSELVGIDILDIDLKQGFVRVLGKRAKVRDCPVGKQAITAVKRWLEARPQIADKAKPPSTTNTKTPPSHPLFLGAQGARISPRIVESAFSQRATEAGISQHLHPHLLRHSFATHILESSGDLRAVQELLGHANITTTEVYTHLDFQAMAKVYDKAHPRARRQAGKIKGKGKP